MSEFHKDENPYLHIFGQEEWHGEAYIVANVQALLQMRKAIDDALSKGYGYVPAYVGDGEGFNTLIIREDDVQVFGKLAVPYSAEIAKQQQPDNVLWPWFLPRVVCAVEDTQAWIKKRYSKEEADEIIQAINEGRK